MQLTDFPVDPHLLVSDIGAVAWTSNSELLFGKDGQLWSVTVTAPTPARVSGAQFADDGSLVSQELSLDGKSLAFVSDRTGWIHMYVIPIDATSEAQARQLSKGDFGAGLGSWSPDSTTIAYHHSTAGNQMERFVDVVTVATGAVEPIVTARGDQNFLGWHPGSYRMYYSVSQYLLQQGYIVLTPDYRGSSGYSRNWATGVRLGLGVNDTADVAAAARAARHQRPQRAVPRFAAGDRHAAEARQAVRDGRLSRRDPLLPARAHPARRVVAGRGVLRRAPEVRAGDDQQITVRRSYTAATPPGSLTSTVVPGPGASLTRIVPLNRCTISREMARPSPAPPVRRERDESSR